MPAVNVADCRSASPIVAPVVSNSIKKDAVGGDDVVGVGEGVAAIGDGRGAVAVASGDWKVPVAVTWP